MFTHPTLSRAKLRNFVPLILAHKSAPFTQQRITGHICHNHNLITFVLNYHTQNFVHVTRLIRSCSIQTAKRHNPTNTFAYPDSRAVGKFGQLATCTCTQLLMCTRNRVDAISRSDENYQYVCVQQPLRIFFQQRRIEGGGGNRGPIPSLLLKYLTWNFYTRM